MLGKASYESHCSVTVVSFCFIATTILKIIMFPLFFILSYFSGGQNFEMAMIQKRNGNI